MLVICPHCSKELKPNDALAGKKIRCPDCGGIVPVPEPPGVAEDIPVVQVTAGPPNEPPSPSEIQPATAARRRPSPVDRDAEPPPKKSNVGLLIGLGCGVLAVVVLGLAGVGGAAWWILTSSSSTTTNPPPKFVEGGGIKPQDNDPGGDGKAAKAVDEPKFTLSAKILRVPATGDVVQFQVDYQAEGGLKDREYYVFYADVPGQPRNDELGFRTGDELRRTPAGKLVWPVFVQDDQAGDAASCQIVVKACTNLALKHEGRVVARLENVKIPPRAKKEITDPQISVTLKEAQRYGTIGNVRLHVGFKAAGALQDNVWYGCYAVFPSRPDPVPLSTMLGKQLGAVPEGMRTNAYLIPGKETVNDATVDVVVKASFDLKDLPNGRELARLKVPLPQEGLSVKLSKLAAKRTSPGKIDFSFDIQTTGSVPDGKAVYFVAELTNPADGKKQRQLVAQLQGAEFKSRTVTGVVTGSEFDQAQVCALYVYDDLPLPKLTPAGGVSVAFFSKLKIQTLKSDIAVQITNPVATRTSPGKIDFSFDVQATGSLPESKAVYFVVEFVNPSDGKKQRHAIARLRGGEFKSGKVTGSLLGAQHDQAQTFTLLADEDLSADAGGKLARLPNLKIEAAKSVPITLQLTNPRVERTTAEGDATVAVDYKFSRKPDADKWYVFYLRYRDKTEPGKVLTLKFAEDRGDILGIQGLMLKQKVKLPVTAIDAMELLVSNEVLRPEEAKPEPPLAVTKFFPVVAFKDGGSPKGDKKDIGKDPQPGSTVTLEVTKAKVTRLAKGQGIGIEVRYELKDGKVNDQATYTCQMAFEGGKSKVPITFYTAKLGEFTSTGTILVTNTYVLTQETNIEVWIVETLPQMPGRIVSNKMQAEFKK